MKALAVVAMVPVALVLAAPFVLIYYAIGMTGLLVMLGVVAGAIGASILARWGGHTLGWW